MNSGGVQDMRSGRSSPGAVGATVPGTDPASPVVLYDGLCGLCDRYVQFVLRRDKHRRFRFAPLQGTFAARTLKRHGITAAMLPSSGPVTPARTDRATLSSVVLVESPGDPRERVRIRSDAVLAILAGLGGAWRLTAVARLVPRPVRDLLYAAVARVRYRLFGKLDACSVPPRGAGPGRFLE